jgi:peptidoglycan-associated lipoprotein
LDIKHVNIFFFFLSLLILQFLFISCGTKSRLTTADKKFEAGEYASAAELYARVYSRISYKDADLRAQVAFNQAECLSRLNYTRAEMMYNRAIRSKYQDSLVYLKYAQAQHRNAKYGEAIKNYQIYLAYDSACVLGQNGLAGAQMAASMRAKPTRYVVSRENAFFARNRHTYSPAFQGTDFDQLFFTSNRAPVKKGVVNNFVTNLPNSNIYNAKKDAAGKWSKPELVFSEEFAAGAELGSCAFSPDGRTMYFTQASQKDDSDAHVEIFFSARAGGEWTTPQQVTFFKDSSITVAHPAIAPDGVTIYFVSDAPNGQGGKDIWKGTLSGSECKFIENLGPQINTPGDEVFPYVRADGTLYFASDGHPGLGGLDIFKATKINEEDWSVVNMGVPVNSNFDDFGVAFEGNKEKGFFSSNRGQIRGFDAIWNFELPETEVVVQGKVLDDKLNPIPDAMVRLISNTGQNTRVITRKDGTYRIKIDKDMDCVMLGTARGFLNKKATVSSRGVKESKVFTVDLVLPAAFRPVQLPNIFFEFAKWDLTPASEKGLQDLLSMLNDNPNIVIEISAHTDYIGNNEFNLTLSQKRAQSVVDYLIAAGISQDRLVSVGHGEDKPYVVDENLHAQYPFLPLEKALTEEFILTLNPAEQEVANQINRRTEFKVIRMSLR